MLTSVKAKSLCDASAALIPAAHGGWRCSGRDEEAAQPNQEALALRITPAATRFLICSHPAAYCRAMSRAATLPYPGDQIIDTDAARSLHADACRSHALVAWVVLWDLPAYPERYAARLLTSSAQASPYLLLADSLAELQAMLPAGLARSERMPVDPPDVVEIWFAG